MTKKKSSKVNMKHSIIQALGYLLMSRRTVLCINACIFTDRDYDKDIFIDKDYKLKRGYTPEEFGRFLEDVNFEMEAIDLVGIIIWYTDGSYSWAHDEDDRIVWTYHDRPNPDSFDL